jgi:hypothetical protein
MCDDQRARATLAGRSVAMRPLSRATGLGLLVLYAVFVILVIR